jgi:hypothetical protein
MDNQNTDQASARFNALAENRKWATRIDPSMAFAAPALNDMREIWASVATQSALPSRAQFTARLLKSHLRNLSVVSIEGGPGRASRYRHRYVGGGVTAVFGELTGQAFEDFMPPNILPRTIACFDAVVEGRMPVRVLTHFQHQRANYLEAEVFAAPLAEDGTTPNMVMTVTAFSQAGDGLVSIWQPEHGSIGYLRVS